MIDERVAAVLGRLEREDAEERERGVPGPERARQVARTTGQFLFALAAPHREVSVLEIGGSRGYSTIWLAAGARIGGGRVVSLEYDPRKLDARRRNVEDAGLSDVAELVDADAFEAIPELDGPFDLCFLDAEKDDYERLFELAREKLRPGSVVVADNVLSHVETLGAYSKARQADPTLVSVTVPLDRGLELTVVFGS
ncbi:MAG TPA: class I SAM-dependent methyltransferase [Gaiellaceae bacterium]